MALSAAVAPAAPSASARAATCGAMSSAIAFLRSPTRRAQSASGWPRITGSSVVLQKSATGSSMLLRYMRCPSPLGSWKCMWTTAESHGPRNAERPATSISSSAARADSHSGSEKCGWLTNRWAWTSPRRASTTSLSAILATKGWRLRRGITSTGQRTNRRCAESVLTSSPSMLATVGCLDSSEGSSRAARAAGTASRNWELARLREISR
mmetsp:Transcript_5860/g.19709  ORF Transcript_5860/g.19709 Transcript_5860/m.19709 type:complete len:210 (-) Transcript_5860:883-1512(-)